MNLSTTDRIRRDAFFYIYFHLPLIFSFNLCEIENTEHGCRAGLSNTVDETASMNDEYSDYSDNEEFHEDALNNEEYDALYAVLPEAKKALSSYNPNIPEIEIKEALYYHYFKIKPALEDLRAKFPKKKGMLSQIFDYFPPILANMHCIDQSINAFDQQSCSHNSLRQIILLFKLSYI